MNSFETGPVLLARDGGIARVTLNRPAALNAFDVATAVAFREVCERLGADRSVRVVVLRGEGTAFGAGGDLAVMREGGAEAAAALIDNLHPAIEILSGLNAPTLASVQGAAMGAGLSLALACDVVLAAKSSRFNLAYAKVGASCDVSASWHLPRIVGLRQALRIALLSETFDADEALRLGIVSEVVADDALQEHTQALALRLANGPTLAYGRMKRLMRQSLGATLPDQLVAEREGFIASAATDDFKEAVAAFLGKLPASFHGQ